MVLKTPQANKNEPDKFDIETKVAIPQSPKDYQYINLLETFKNRSYTKAEIEENLSKLIEECYEELGKFEPNKDFEDFDLAIEWILPDELFSLDVDCWQYKEDEINGKETRIGCASFPSVHIRSYRRLKHKHRRKKWIDKWNLLMSNFQEIDKKHYIFACQSKTKSNNDLKIVDNKDGIIGINFPADLQELENMNYDFIIQTGIPLALWSRCKQSQENHIRELDILINPENGNVLNLENLPKSIENKRLEAKSNQPLHLGHHLCFLWENPYNYPLTPKYNKMK